MNEIHVSPYLPMLQWALVVGFVGLLAQVPGLRLVGIPSISMAVALFVGSVMPKMAPGIYSQVFPETPAWTSVINMLVIPILGFMAGSEIDFRLMKTMGRTGMRFIGGSILAPMLFALPVGIALAVLKTPFTPEGASGFAIVLGITFLVVMRALPVMIAFFRHQEWNSDIARASLAGASFDDLIVFVVVQPIIVGLGTGQGATGVINSATAVIITAVIIAIAGIIIRRLPKNIAITIAFPFLYSIGYFAEHFGGVHLVLSGLFFGIAVGAHIAHSFENHVKSWVLTVGVPLFFAGLGLTRKFDILTPSPWLLATVLFSVNYLAHSKVTARLGSDLFDGNIAAGKSMAGLCRTKGLADVLFALAVAQSGALTDTGLAAVMLFAVAATFGGLFEAQNSAIQYPELAYLQITPVIRSAGVRFFGGQPEPVLVTEDIEVLEVRNIESNE